MNVECDITIGPFSENYANRLVSFIPLLQVMNPVLLLKYTVLPKHLVLKLLPQEKGKTILLTFMPILQCPNGKRKLKNVK